MRTTKTIITRVMSLVVMALFLASCSSAPEQSASTDVETGKILTRSYDFKAAGKDMGYALYVPASYNKNKPTPLVVLLHGLTSNPNAVLGYEGITDQADKYGMIVVAPFGYNEGGWYGSRGKGNDFGDRTANMFTQGTPENLGELSEQDVLNVLDIVRNEFNIDAKRTYLMGHSMGGAGTLHLGIKYHNQWAAIAEMSPAVFNGPTGPLANLKNVPIITVQGDKDELVPVATVRELVKEFDAAGLTSKYIEIPGGDHVRAISRNPEMIAEVFEFLTTYSK